MDAGDPSARHGGRTRWRKCGRRYAVLGAARILTAALGATAVSGRPHWTVMRHLTATRRPWQRGAPSGIGSPPAGLAMEATPSRPAPASAPRGCRHPGTIDPAALTVTNTGSLPKRPPHAAGGLGTADLTGQGQLAWAADAGHPVGNARCTQNFRFNPKRRPRNADHAALLAHERDKSVYIVAVDLDRRPSEQAAEATIDKVWSELG